MKIEHQQIGSVEVITIRGALVEEDATRFSEEVRKSATGQNPRLVLDMREVPYLDSEALEGLTDACDLLDDRCSKLRLATVSQTVREVLQLIGLSGRFQFFEKVDDAVRSFL